MLRVPFHKSLVLTGPTSSGKTVLGVELAERLDAEIISMDSMALYRGMDIGTAKPNAEERRRIRHHLIDVLDPWEAGSVAWWLNAAAHCVRDIENRGKQVLFVGGTPLYLKALMHGLFQGPPADLELRGRLETEARQAGSPVLWQRLAAVDPLSAARLHPNDTRRLIRALEVWELTGRPLSTWQTQWRELPAEESGRVQVIWLDLPREELYARIDARVDRMIEAGLVEEVRALRRLPLPVSREAAQGLGYKEVFAFLDGATPLEDTVTRIQMRCRRFAKRQLTWFRHLPGCERRTRQLTFAAWGLTMDQ
jgi:tRNA dimethylallyltransferase